MSTRATCPLYPDEVDVDINSSKYWKQKLTKICRLDRNERYRMCKQFLIYSGHLFFLFSFFFQWCYIPRWDLTSSMTFRPSSHDSTLSLQFLHPTLVTSSSDSPHHLNFGLPLLATSNSSRFSTKDFPCTVTFFQPHHVSSPS